MCIQPNSQPLSNACLARIRVLRHKLSHALTCYISLDTDCQSDSDCKQLDAVCEGKPKQCKFTCFDSMHCAEGICTDITRETTGSAIAVCMPECDGEYNHCLDGQLCIGRNLGVCLIQLQFSPLMDAI